MTISFNYSNAQPFMKKHEVENLSEFVKIAHQMLHEKKGPGIKLFLVKITKSIVNYNKIV